MTGESPFTVHGLHIHFDKQIADLKAKLDERHEDQQAANKSAREHDQEANKSAREHDHRVSDRRHDALDKEFHEHLVQAKTENELAVRNAEKALDKALASAKEAVSKSEARYDARFVEANHVREQLSDQAATFIPRTESLAKHEATGEKLDAHSKITTEALADLRAKIGDVAVNSMPRNEVETHGAITMERLREIEIRMQSYPSRDETALALTAADAKSAAAISSATEKSEAMGARLSALDLRLTSRLDVSSGRSSGYNAVYGWAVAGIGLLITAIVLANTLIGK